MIPMHKKGITLVELLAAIVIMGIATALIVQIVGLLLNASEKALNNARANTQGMVTVEILESTMRQFEPTDISFCVGSAECIILEKHFIDEVVGESIVTTNYVPPLLLTIELIDGVFEINNNEQLSEAGPSDFVILSSSTLRVLNASGNEIINEISFINGAQVTVEISIHIATDLDSDEIYSYTASYTFNIDIR